MRKLWCWIVGHDWLGEDDETDVRVCDRCDTWTGYPKPPEVK